jgi:hypothetical protein
MSLNVEKLEAALHKGDEVSRHVVQGRNGSRKGRSVRSGAWHKEQAAKPFYQSGPGILRNPLLTAAEGVASSSFRQIDQLAGEPSRRSRSVLIARRPTWVEEWRITCWKSTSAVGRWFATLILTGLCRQPDRTSGSIG